MCSAKREERSEVSGILILCEGGTKRGRQDENAFEAVLKQVVQCLEVPALLIIHAKRRWDEHAFRTVIGNKVGPESQAP